MAHPEVFSGTMVIWADRARIYHCSLENCLRPRGAAILLSLQVKIMVQMIYIALGLVAFAYVELDAEGMMVMSLEALEIDTVVARMAAMMPWIEISRN